MNINNLNKEKQLHYMSFLNRENNSRHHYYDEEMLQYEYLKTGNFDAIEESIRMFSSPTTGYLSNDPLRNIKYLFVASITLATRFAIEGGMDSETAYNSSDLYINTMDKLTTIDEVKKLHTDMFTYFTTEINKLSTKNIYSKPIIQIMDYVYEHLYDTITVSTLAHHVKLNSNYLSILFKKEVGIPISDYIRKKRIEAAENMLKYSEYNYAQISSYLAFSSQSYFIKVFKKETGYTPKEYRKLFFRNSFRQNNK